MFNSSRLAVMVVVAVAVTKVVSITIVDATIVVMITEAIEVTVVTTHLVHKHSRGACTLYDTR